LLKSSFLVTDRPMALPMIKAKAGFIWKATDRQMVAQLTMVLAIQGYRLKDRPMA
jgi:hypothetical protein